MPIKIVANQINSGTLQPVNAYLSNFLPQLDALKLDENILKTFNRRNILPTDPNEDETDLIL